MVKLLVGLLVVGAVTASTGMAAAHQSSSQSNLTGYTKEQCKHGGWEDLGFRNQGQCVSTFAKKQ